MRQSVGKFTVVRAQESAARVEVEPSNRDHAHSNRLQQLSDRWAPFRIAQRTHHAARLVQHDINERLWHQPITIDLDLRFACINPHTQLIDYPAIHFDAPLGDQFLSRTPRSDTSTSQDFLKTFVCHKGGRV